MAELLRQYWLAAILLVVGAVAIVAIGFSGASTGAVMVAGAVIGILAGMAIAAASGRGKQ